jgi:thiol:disulfide interchange protein DsbC
MSGVKGWQCASLSPSWCNETGCKLSLRIHPLGTDLMQPFADSHARIRALAPGLLLALALGIQPAHGAPPLPPALTDLSTHIQASVELPGTGVQMLELDGQSVYLAGGGRYVFTGSAWDLWHGLELRDVAQASELAGRIDRDRLPLDAMDLGALALGGGKAEDTPLWLFVDPLDSASLELLRQIKRARIPAQVILLPLGGPESLSAARRLRCAPSTAMALDALIASDTGALPEPTTGCDTQPLVRALITARLLGVEQVPLLIAPDGRLHRGVPADLDAWMGEGDA